MVVEVAGALNARQVAVLKWIADGCPDGVMAGFTCKTTAVALQGRRLVTVSRRRGVLSAVVTDAGRFYLVHGRHPDRAQTAAAGGGGAANPRRRTGPSGRVPSRTRPAPPVTAARGGGNDSLGDAAPGQPVGGRTPEPDLLPGEHGRPAPASAIATLAAARPKGPVDRLIADLVQAGGVLRVQRPRYLAGQRQDGVDYEQLVLAANRYGKVPPGMRLTTTVLAWPDVQIRLEPAIPGTDVARRPVPVPDRVARYHPVVVQFRDRSDRHEVSKALLPRALRLLHALATEAERRGHTVTLAPDPHTAYGRDRWTGSQDGHVAVTVDGHPQALRLLEVGMPSRAHWERTNYFSRRPYAANTATGQLRIELTGYGGREGRTCRWADGKRSSLEEKLPDVLAEIEIRAAEDTHREREARQQAAEEQRQRELPWSRSQPAPGRSPSEETGGAQGPPPPHRRKAP